MKHTCYNILKYIVKNVYMSTRALLLTYILQTHVPVGIVPRHKISQEPPKKICVNHIIIIYQMIVTILLNDDMNVDEFLKI
jgi:hypothetical protein